MVKQNASRTTTKTGATTSATGFIFASMNRYPALKTGVEATAQSRNSHRFDSSVESPAKSYSSPVPPKAHINQFLSDSVSV